MNIQNIIDYMIKTNPSAARSWEKANSLLNGKTPDEQRQIVNDFMKNQGVTMEGLKRYANYFGIKL